MSRIFHCVLTVCFTEGGVRGGGGGIQNRKTEPQRNTQKKPQTASEVSVVATKKSQSKELRVRDGVLDVCWVG